MPSIIISKLINIGKEKIMNFSQFHGIKLFEFLNVQFL